MSQLDFVECLFYSAKIGIDFDYLPEDGSVRVASVDKLSEFIKENIHIDRLAKTIVQRRRSYKQQDVAKLCFDEDGGMGAEPEDTFPSSHIAHRPPPIPTFTSDRQETDDQVISKSNKAGVEMDDAPPIFSPPPVPFTMSQEFRDASGSELTCDGVEWMTLPLDCPLVGSKVVSINGVNLTGLDVAFQQALIHQHYRPLYIIFSCPESKVKDFPPIIYVNLEAVSTNTRKAADMSLESVDDLQIIEIVDHNCPTQSDNLYLEDTFTTQLEEAVVSSPETCKEIGSGANHSSVTPVRHPITFDKFVTVFEQSSACKVLKKKVLGLIKDYKECDWASAIRDGAGMPQQTVVSLYRYLDQGVEKIDFHNQVSPTSTIDSLAQSVISFSGTNSPITPNGGGSNGDTFVGLSFEERQELHDHIETYILKELIAYTSLKIAPLFVSKTIPLINYNEVYNTSSDWNNESGSSTPLELPKLTTFSLKCAFLRFMTLEMLGLKYVHPREMLLIPVMSLLAAEQHRSDSRTLVGKTRSLYEREEWRLAMRGLSRAMSFHMPADILNKLSITMRLITHSVDTYINRRSLLFTRLQCHKCSQVHFCVNEALEELSFEDSEDDSEDDDGYDDTAHEVPLHSDDDDDEIGAVATSITRQFIVAPIISSKMLKSSSLSLANDVHPNVASTTATLASGVFKRFYKSNSLATDKSTIPCLNDSGGELSADELMPAVIWVVINSVPEDIETNLWLCGEFRHPDRLRGEEGYALAQFQSAVEFIKAADASSLEVSDELFKHELFRFHCAMKAFEACRRGQLSELKNWISRGASADGKTILNVLTVDQHDCLLSIAIKKKYLDVVVYLSSLTPFINLNMLLSPCKDLLLSIGSDDHPQMASSNQQLQVMCITPLFYAVASLQVDIIILLLRLGASRYHVDDFGNSLLDIARMLPSVTWMDSNNIQHTTSDKDDIVDILAADPNQIDYASCIREKNIHSLRGLILQGVDINLPFDRGTMTPLHLAATIFTSSSREAEAMESSAATEVAPIPGSRILDIDTSSSIGILRSLLALPLVNVNQRNSRGETPLLYAVKQSSLNPSYGMVLSVAMLLRSGADKTIPDLHNFSPVRWMDSFFIKNKRRSEKNRSMSDSLNGYRESLGFSNQRLSMAGAVLSPVGGIVASAMAEEQQRQLVQQEMNNGASDEVIDLYSYNHSVRDHLASFLVSKVKDPKLDIYELIYYNPEMHFIYELARKRNMNGVVSLLRQGCNINIQCPIRKFNALTPAVCNQDYPLVELLLQAHKLLKDFHLSTDDESVSIDVNAADVDGMRPIHHAAQIGDVKLVGRLIHAHANRFLKTTQGLTALEIAMKAGHLETAHLLKCDPRSTSICLTASLGDWRLLKILLNQGVNINSTEIHDSISGGIHHELYTPLIAAASHVQTELVKNIISLCAPVINVNIANRIGMTALMYSASKGDEQSVLKLLTNGANRNMLDLKGLTASDWALKNGFDGLSRLIHNDPDKIYVHDIIRGSDLAACLGMFRQGANPNQQRYYPRPIEKMVSTIQQGHTAVGSPPATGAFKAPSVHPKDQPIYIPGETPLIVAASCSKNEVMALLLKAPDIKINLADAQGWTPLFHAVHNDNEEGVIKLLQAGASRRTQDLMGRTAVDVGIEKGYVQLCALVEADPMQMYPHDMCALGKVFLVLALIKQGCPSNYRDDREGNESRTLLMAACQGKQLTVVKHLLRDPKIISEGLNLRDDLGRTALMIAAFHGALDITGLLLTAGCDRKLTDKQGWSAKDYAARHSLTTMMKYMGQTAYR